MLSSIYLGRLKSTMKLCIFYCRSICPLAFDFKPVLFPGFNFLIETMYGTHGISHIILDNIIFLLVFLSWNWFSFIAAYIFSRNVKVFSIFFCLRLIFIFLESTNFFIYDLCTALEPSIKKILASYIQQILLSSALCFALRKLSCICPILLLWSTSLLLDNQVFLSFVFVLLILPVL